MLSLLLGLLGFGFSMWNLMVNPSTTFTGFIEPSALVLLSVGPISVILISHNFMDLFSGIRTVFSMAFLNQTKEMNNIANQLSHLTAAVRTDGMGTLVNYKDKIRNKLFKDGIVLILNSFSAQEIKHNLTAKINARQLQFQHAANLFESLGKLCPGMGLLGTIVGLVQMLTNMSDPSKIGAGMAVSLLTTLYGLILGTVVYTPISEKLLLHAEKVQQLDMMIMEGVLLLKEKKSNAHLRDVLSTYSNQSSASQSTQAPGSQMPGRANNSGIKAG